MAAGAGLLLLAFTVTAMHFLVVVGFMPLGPAPQRPVERAIRLHVAYTEGQGVMTRLLQACDRRQWQLTELTADPQGEPLGTASGQVGVMLTLAGSGILTAPTVLAGIDGVTAIRQLDEDPD